MKKLFALVLLVFNFIKSLLLSGWDTARVIVRQKPVTGGLIRMNYGNLSPVAASVLGALVTLTPGTTAVEIDLERQEFVLHLLDLSQRDSALESIQTDFITPLAILMGGQTP